MLVLRILNLKRLFNKKDESVSTRKNELEQKLMTARTKMEHENLSVQVTVFTVFKFPEGHPSCRLPDLGSENQENLMFSLVFH